MNQFMNIVFGTLIFGVACGPIAQCLMAHQWLGAGIWFVLADIAFRLSKVGT